MPATQVTGIPFHAPKLTFVDRKPKLTWVRAQWGAGVLSVMGVSFTVREAGQQPLQCLQAAENY
jgi:hypothetical protein